MIEARARIGQNTRMEPSAHAITPHTRVYAVLGHPVRHSLSPAMHNTAFRALGMDAVYVALEILPEKLLPALDALAGLGFGGVNLTIPHKQVAFQGLSAHDESARLVGGVMASNHRSVALHKRLGYRLIPNPDKNDPVDLITVLDNPGL